MTTPLGLPVEPEVYIIYTESVGEPLNNKFSFSILSYKLLLIFMLMNFVLIFVL